MKALTVRPGQADSARVEDVPEPPADRGGVLVQALAVGVCGTDLEITSGKYGWAPPGKDRLVLGHESLGRVLEAPADSGFKAGDLVAGIVRLPDPVPCPNCAAGEWDMCRNGKYTEHGIKEVDGFCSERWRVQPQPRGQGGPAPRAPGRPDGAGERTGQGVGAHRADRPAGRLAADDGCSSPGPGRSACWRRSWAASAGWRSTSSTGVTDGPKPQLVKDLGAHYHTGAVKDLAAVADVVIECTGVGALVFDILQHNRPGCVTCLTGISSGGRAVPIDLAPLNKTMVLENDVVFGSVNANRRHYELAADALAKADRKWLARVVNRAVPLADWKDALTRRPDDVKPVIRLAEA